MLDESAYAPVAPRVAQIESGERHLHSFIISPYVYEKRGGMLLKFAAWHPDNTRYYLHLTDQRMLLEPHERSMKEKLLTQGLLMLAGNVLGGSGGEFAVKHGANALKEGDRKTAAARGSYAAISYREIDRVESFRQGLATLIRLVLKAHPDQPVVFQVLPSKQQVLTLSGCPAEFLQIMRNILG